MIRWYKIGPHERGLLYRAGEWVELLGPGRHVRWDPLLRLRLERASVRDVALVREDLDVIARSGALEADARVLDLRDHERALVWVDGRYRGALGPGLHALWTAWRKVVVELVDARAVRLEHPELDRIVSAPRAAELLDVVSVEAGAAAVVLRDGRVLETLGPGRYAYWKGMGRIAARAVDLRETTVDIAGQELMTADKVTLRMNAVATVRVVDAARSVTATDDARQALYREAQLALRAAVGGRELDALLADKEAVSAELAEAVRARAAAIGVEVVRIGIRDVILPGDMKDLLNRVTEAKKAAEAALITRREETAAMRSQANTAKLLEGSPTLMRMRELEVLEKVAAKANLTVLLGEGHGLADRVAKLL